MRLLLDHLFDFLYSEIASIFENQMKELKAEDSSDREQHVMLSTEP